MQLRPNEHILLGEWQLENGKLVAGATTERIACLIDKYLEKIKSSPDGWSVLYLDRSGGRYWRLSYPNSGQHGGGAPCLELISDAEVRAKFHLQS